MDRMMKAAGERLQEKGRTRRAYRPHLGIERCEERALLSLAVVSITPTGAPGDNGSYLGALASSSLPAASPSATPSTAMSADGSLLVFQSDADNLVSGQGDANQATDVFVRNLKTGSTQLVSVTPTGQTGNGRSFDPVISPDGRYVAFLSTATNLSSVAANPLPAGAPDGSGLLYVRDLKTGTTTLVDATAAGAGSNGLATGTFAFSPNSASLAFLDTSTNLTSGTSAATPSNNANVYLYTLSAGTTQAVSVTPGGALSQGSSITTPGATSLVFSPDGKSLAFTSNATDLTRTPASLISGAGGATNLYLANLASGSIALVSGSADGHLSDGSSGTPVFSPDGGLLAYLSTSNDITAAAQGPAQANQNVFVYNISTGQNTAQSVTSQGVLSAGTVTQMVFSPDGKTLAFDSTGNDLTSNAADTPLSAINNNAMGWNASNVYLRDLSAGTTRALSVSPSGNLSNGFVGDLQFSPDGQNLAYLSSADDLTGNTPPPLSDPSPNGGAASPLPNAPATPASNLFLTNLATGTTSLLSVTPTGTLSSGNVLSYAFRPDGQAVAFDALSNDLTNNPPTVASSPATVPGASSSGVNVFVRDLSRRRPAWSARRPTARSPTIHRAERRSRCSTVPTARPSISAMPPVL